jgi:hypothetical protein
LCLSEKAERRKLGSKLKAQYSEWTETLNLKDFLAFNETIKKNKDEIGAAQFFGKFRAYAFEEYVYRLLKEKIRIPKPLEMFWGEKCLVWREGKKEYALEFDVSIGKEVARFIEPVIVFDAKVELDSARLKTALASFAILKRWNPKVKCILVYVTRDLAYSLLELASYWMDGIFQFSLEKNENAAFLNCVATSLS